MNTFIIVALVSYVGLPIAGRWEGRQPARQLVKTGQEAKGEGGVEATGQAGTHP